MDTLPDTRRSLLRLLMLGRPVRATLLLAVLFGSTTVACGVGLLAISGFLLARAAQHPNVVALSVAVVAVRALGIGRGLSRYVERLTSHDAALRVLSDLRASVYSRLERLAPSGLTRLRGGDLVARFVSDVDAVQDLFIRGIAPPVVAALVGAVTTLFAMAVFAPGGLLLGAGLLAAGVGLPALAALAGRRSAAGGARARGDLASATVDVVDGAAELIAYGAVPQALDRVADCDARLTRVARHSAAAHGLGTGGATLVSGLTVFGVLLAGVGGAHRGSLGSVPLAVLVLAALAAFEVTAPLPAAAIALQSVGASARRIFGVVDAPRPTIDPVDPVTMAEGPGHIRLSGVGARYPGSDHEVLAGIELDLPPGRRVAVVGSSGAGKSTLAAVLLRFVDVTEGLFVLDGVDAATMAGDDVRMVVSGCTADPHVFDSTIRENLRLARPGASDDDLLAALSAVHLGEWVDSLPAGLATSVGAHGLAMSGGQRQRLALARAVLADPKVLVLDEPTAHLDPETADAVMRDILMLSRGRTTLLITHDERGLSEMDEVVVLAEGRVVERRLREAP